MNTAVYLSPHLCQTGNVPLKIRYLFIRFLYFCIIAYRSYVILSPVTLLLRYIAVLNTSTIDSELKIFLCHVACSVFIVVVFHIIPHRSGCQTKTKPRIMIYTLSRDTHSVTDRRVCPVRRVNEHVWFHAQCRLIKQG